VVRGGPPVSCLLEAEHLEVDFPVRSGVLWNRTVGTVSAVSDVSLRLGEAETLGVVGESGCGKTTLIRSLARLQDLAGGSIRFEGHDVTRAGRRELAPVRRGMQMVFQDAQASLNPRRRIGQIMATPLRLRGVPAGEVGRRSGELLRRVGLDPEYLGRFPHELSGGQRQRIGIARALAVEPRVILLDEPVSALDVSIQAQVINLLADLQEELGLSYLLVAHDLSVVRHVCDRVGVMYLGKVVELAAAPELYAKPIHPYTGALLAAVPIPDPRRNRARVRTVLEGDPPDAVSPPPGCRFHTRCPRASRLCMTVEPPLTEYSGGHLAACHYPLNVTPTEISAARRSPDSPLGAGAEPARVHALPMPA